MTGYTQGTTYQVTYYHSDSIVTQASVNKILSSVDSSLSIYIPGSLINRFNTSHESIVADIHLLEVVKRAKEIYKETNGLFDITIKPITDIWGFGVKRSESIPDSNKISKLVKCINSDYIWIEQHYLKKSKPCVQIDVNGIAQGYTVDLIAAHLENNGIKNYLVEIGGEIRVKGTHQPDQIPFRLGIESPASDPMQEAIFQKIITLDGGAITTSGNYRKYYESQGRTISHLLNPLTGFPASNELISVTVFAPDAITADGYDNALMLMGLKNAMQFVEQRPWLAAYFIYRNPEGAVTDTLSSRFLSLIQ